MNVLTRLGRKLRRDGLVSTSMAIAEHALRFKREIAYQKMLTKDSIQDRFSSIYQHNLWGSSESGSGEGSELHYTENLRNWLVGAVPKYSVLLLSTRRAATLTG